MSSGTYCVFYRKEKEGKNAYNIRERSDNDIQRHQIMIA
jgi:hypothetical protein